MSKTQRQSAVILGAQWGDEGKGKIVDVLSERFSVVARYAGGHNAGHTVIIHGKKFVLQLIPCGVLRPGCKGVIGNGVVLDPAAFLGEVKKLRDAGLPVDDQLFVSDRAQVILPYHRMIELAAETAPGRTKIGTTRRGIGPAYEDKIHRNGLRVVDLLNSSLLRTHIQNACHEKNTIAHALFGTEPLDPKAMYEEYARLAEQVAPFVTDTAVMLNDAITNGEKVMFEGAQGALLDIDHGTYRPSCDQAPPRRLAAQSPEPASAPPKSAPSSASPRLTSPASARDRSPPKSTATPRNSCVLAVRSTAPSPDVRAAAAGSTSLFSATPT